MNDAMRCIAGSRISLISKKNIRYEGTLYSINESNATVALQNVRSYGTEGREKLDPTAAFVPPQDSVHPYLLFRGCDIKDLHVHENAVSQPPADPAIMSTGTPEPPTPQQQSTTTPAAPAAPASKPASGQSNKAGKPKEERKPKPALDDGKAASAPVVDKENKDADNDEAKYANQGVKGNRKKKGETTSQVGTGASLLNRKVRGTKDGGKALVS